MKHPYRVIELATWRDTRVRGLSRPRPNAHSLWTQLLAGRHTTVIPGVVEAGAGALADETGWSARSVRRCFAELERSGLALADWDAGIVYVPEQLLRAGKPNPVNEPSNASQLLGWLQRWDRLVECPLRERIFADLGAVATQCGGKWNNYESTLGAELVGRLAHTVAETVSDTVAETVSDTVAETVSDLSTQILSTQYSEKEERETSASHVARAHEATPVPEPAPAVAGVPLPSSESLPSLNSQELCPLSRRREVAKLLAAEHNRVREALGLKPYAVRDGPVNSAVDWLVVALGVHAPAELSNAIAVAAAEIRGKRSAGKPDGAKYFGPGMWRSPQLADLVADDPGRRERAEAPARAPPQDRDPRFGSLFIPAGATGRHDPNKDNAF